MRGRDGRGATTSTMYSKWCWPQPGVTSCSTQYTCSPSNGQRTKCSSDTVSDAVARALRGITLMKSFHGIKAELGFSPWTVALPVCKCSIQSTVGSAAMQIFLARVSSLKARLRLIPHTDLPPYHSCSQSSYHLVGIQTIRAVQANCSNKVVIKVAKHKSWQAKISPLTKNKNKNHSNVLCLYEYWVVHFLFFWIWNNPHGYNPHLK